MSSEVKENTSFNTAAKMWAKYGEAYFPCEEAVDKLRPGQYTIETSQQRGVYFNEIKVNTDELMVLPDTASDKIIQQIEDFWTKKEKYGSFNFVWKRGFLLWGPPGSGKTTTIQLVANSIIEKDGICVFVKNPSVAATGLEVLRKIEPDRPVVVILEDIDAITQRFSESELLALLDGELQIQNVVFLATTNYPEKLDKRLVNRPSRFDVVQKIDYPNDAARRLYLGRKNPSLLTKTIETEENAEEVKKLKKSLDVRQADLFDIDNKLAEVKKKLTDNLGEVEKLELEESAKRLTKASEEKTLEVSELVEQVNTTSKSVLAIDHWVANTNKFSIAHLKELILSVELFDVPFETTLKRLRKMMDQKVSQNSDDYANI